MTYAELSGLALDDRLAELAAGVVERVGFEPPEFRERLRPPRLRVLKGPRGVNSYCVPNTDGTKMILVGSDLYPFVHHYTRAAATYFLPDELGGSRPSPFWPHARSALATTLEWIASPVDEPIYPQFDLSAYQAHVARAFAAFTYRFALCHEMAHVALEHVDATSAEPRRVGGKNYEVLIASQQQEFVADQFGLHLQIKSLPDSSQLATALASAVYFVHITGLLDFRLAMLRYLVDWDHWKIEYTHPPALPRVFKLMAAAEGLHGGAGEGLRTVHDSLNPMDGEFFTAANEQQEEAAERALTLVDEEVARNALLAGDETRSASRPENEYQAPGNLSPGVITDLLRLFERSPLGVLLALEEESAAGIGADEHHLRSSVKGQFASALPQEFQRFRLLTRAQRAEQLA